MNQWKTKFKAENDSRHMLDDNLRVLGRRVNDLELDLSEKNERLQILERERKEL